MFFSSIAGIRPKWIAMSSASIDVTFIELTCKHWTMELSVQMCMAMVATCDFFMSSSVMIAMLWDDI